MAEIAIHNVRDPGQDARRALEGFLGRPLAEEEQVSVAALAARPAPCGEARRTAAERLSESLKSISESARAIPSGELEPLIDEAMEDVRRRRRSADEAGLTCDLGRWRHSRPFRG